MTADRILTTKLIARHSKYLRCPRYEGVTSQLQRHVYGTPYRLLKQMIDVDSTAVLTDMQLPTRDACGQPSTRPTTDHRHGSGSLQVRKKTQRLTSLAKSGSDSAGAVFRSSQIHRSSDHSHGLLTSCLHQLHPTWGRPLNRLR